MWDGHRLGDLVPVAELEVRGLRNRYRWPGLGAPLAAGTEPTAVLAYNLATSCAPWRCPTTSLGGR